MLCIQGHDVDNVVDDDDDDDDDDDNDDDDDDDDNDDDDDDDDDDVADAVVVVFVDVDVVFVAFSLGSNHRVTSPLCSSARSPTDTNRSPSSFSSLQPARVSTCSTLSFLEQTTVHRSDPLCIIRTRTKSSSSPTDCREESSFCAGEKKKKKRERKMKTKCKSQNKLFQKQTISFPKL